MTQVLKLNIRGLKVQSETSSCSADGLSVITLAGCGFIQGLQCTQGRPLILTHVLLD